MLINIRWRELKCWWCAWDMFRQFGDEVTSRIGKEPEEIFSEMRATDVYVC